jgi:uncharacterized membrane protein YhaH (DUF805 family)
MFMPLKRYAEFSGRSRRMEYWMWALFQILLYVGVLVLLGVFAGGAIMSGDPSALMAAGGGALIIIAAYGIVQLALIVPNLAVAVRRLHDTDRSGWWLLAPVVPYIVMLVAGGASISSTGGPGAGTGAVVLICMLAALVLGLVLFVFMLLEGTKGPNKYGADPKASEGTAPVVA